MQLISFQERVQEAPLDQTDQRWQRDADAPHCSECCASFGMLRRRHHCRQCGKVFCGACAAGRLPRSRLRACDACVAATERTLMLGLSG